MVTACQRKYRRVQGVFAEPQAEQADHHEPRDLDRCGGELRVAALNVSTLIGREFMIAGLGQHIVGMQEIFASQKIKEGRSLHSSRKMASRSSVARFTEQISDRENDMKVCVSDQWQSAQQGRGRRGLCTTCGRKEQKKRRTR